MTTEISRDDAQLVECEKTRAYIQEALVAFACPEHGETPTVDVLETGKYLRVKVSACCEEHTERTLEKIGAMRPRPT